MGGYWTDARDAGEQTFLRFGIVFGLIDPAGTLDDLVRALRRLKRDHGPVEQWLLADPPTWQFKDFSLYRKRPYDWSFDQ